MQQLVLLHDRRFMLAATAMGAFITIILALTILSQKYSGSVLTVSDVGAFLCAAVAGLVFLLAWRRMGKGDVSSRVWGLVAIGVGLWAAAEAAWGYYELVLRVEVPYPSIADALWLSGYIPLYIALGLRSRNRGSAASTKQRLMGLAFMCLYSLLAIIFVIRPLIDGFEPARLSETIVNAAYPLADWGLGSLTLLIIFSVEGGRLAKAWRLFGAGILAMGTADLVFMYADWNGLYFPGGQPNAISLLLDVMYNASYMTIALAAVAYLVITEIIHAGSLNITCESRASMKVLVFVDRNVQIMSLSDNFASLVSAVETKSYVGTDLEKALHLSAMRGSDLTEQIRRGERLRNQQIQIRDSTGTGKPAYITSLFQIGEHEASGAICMLITAEMPAGATVRPLRPDQEMLIQRYWQDTDAGIAEESRIMRSYFASQISLLYSLLQQFNGARMAGRLLDYVEEVARLNHWELKHSAGTLTVPDELEGRGLSEILGSVLEEARSFAAEMTTQQLVDQEMRSLDKSLARDVMRTVDKYGLRTGAPEARRRSQASAPQPSAA